MYLIRNLCHRTDISMGSHGFTIDLSDAFRAMVELCEITQDNIDMQIKTCGRLWLDAAGFDTIYDPDADAFDDLDGKKKKPPGPNARPMYQPGFDLRVAWGDWGPEHITVPGDACGIELDSNSFGCVFDRGARLVPHNVDSLKQKYLLLIVFTEIAESVAMLSHGKTLTEGK